MRSNKLNFKILHELKMKLAKAPMKADVYVHESIDQSFRFYVKASRSHIIIFGIILSASNSCR